MTFLPSPSPPKDPTKERVQKIYGHSRADMTDRYCEYQTKQMKVALEGVLMSASWPVMSEPSAKRKGESNGGVVTFGNSGTADVR